MEHLIANQIKQQLRNDRVVLYMKGSRAEPLCGFSSRVVELLDRLGVDYVDYDVLQDEWLRSGIKTFSNWPTIPQLYVEMRFVGGCDIVEQMEARGELTQLLVPQ